MLVGGMLFFFAETTKYHSSDGSPKAAVWLGYVDPVVSLLMIIFILITTLPLTKEVMLILLQAAPKHLDAERLQRELLSAEGVLGAHALHVWEFVEGVVIGSVHVKYAAGEEPTPVVRRVLGILKAHGVAFATVQPEPQAHAPTAVTPTSRPGQPIAVSSYVSHDESASCVTKHV